MNISQSFYANFSHSFQMIASSLSIKVKNKHKSQQSVLDLTNKTWCVFDFTQKSDDVRWVNAVSESQVNIITQDICPGNTSGIIHHNTLATAASINTSTVHLQSKLSSLLTSTAWVYFGELYRLKNWVRIKMSRTALQVSLWLGQNVTGHVLPLYVQPPTAVPERPCVSLYVKPTQ